jgi:hypothetical protein|nr:MAG TPA: hypothetical protein [Caudoviricetes sp.]
MTNDTDRAINAILEGVNYLIERAMQKNGTQIYTGRVVSQGNNGQWNVIYNGKTYPIDYYGTGEPSVNQVVKIFVPQGNQSIAFFI